MKSNKKVKILILSNSNPYKTAGIIAKDILDGFKSRNEFQVKLVTKTWDRYQDSDIISIDSFIEYLFKKGKRKVINLLKRIGLIKTPNINHDFSVQDYNQSVSHYTAEKILKKIDYIPDVIFVLFTQTFLTHKNIFDLQKLTSAKIYWQLADMASFTGLCHYSWDCNGYEKACGKCPAIYSKKNNDISYQNLKFKIQNIEKTDLRVIIGSDWLIKKAQKSSVFKRKKISKVFISVEEKNFHPVSNKAKLRTKYKIAFDSFVIAFGSVNLNSKRKGIKYIIEALGIVQKKYSGNKKISVLYSGRGSIDVNYENVHLSHLSRNDLPEFYQLSDMFINTSIQDVGPYMLLEALMCGIPVVSFNTGIASDFVINNQTGYLTSDISSISLSDRVLELLHLSEGKLSKMKDTAFKRSRKLLSKDVQIESYIKLLKEDKLL